jgi:hypothetical protein
MHREEERANSFAPRLIEVWINWAVFSEQCNSVKRRSGDESIDAVHIYVVPSSAAFDVR